MNLHYIVSYKDPRVVSTMPLLYFFMVGWLTSFLNCSLATLIAIAAWIVNTRLVGLVFRIFHLDKLHFHLPTLKCMNCHDTHDRLSEWQLVVPSVMAKLTSWQLLFLSIIMVIDCHVYSVNMPKWAWTWSEKDQYWFNSGMFTGYRVWCLLSENSFIQCIKNLSWLYLSWHITNDSCHNLHQGFHPSLPKAWPDFPQHCFRRFNQIEVNWFPL